MDIDLIGLFLWSKRQMDASEAASMYSQVIAMLSTGLIVPMCSASTTAVTSIAYSHENLPDEPWEQHITAQISFFHALQ